MPYLARPAENYTIDASLGNIDGIAKVNKFGEALDCDLNTPTDIWDGADGTTSTDIWVAPTQARIHDIASTSTDDDGDPAGTGAHTIRIWGLQTWASAESSEDLTLDGTTNVPTANSYVIIHRMRILAAGSGGTNAGIITATAQTDGTITAGIQAGEGQTLMAIYGVPSNKTIAVTNAGARLTSNNSTAFVVGKILVKENADTSTGLFITKDKFTLQRDQVWRSDYVPPKTYAGPCILKLQVESLSQTSLQVQANFDAYVIDD